MKTAIISGVSGQDGAYLSALLLHKGYRVVGLIRHRAFQNLKNLEYLKVSADVILEECDLLNLSDTMKLIKKYNPDEIYHLAAQSSVGLSFEQPVETVNFNILSTLNFLESIRKIDLKIKFYHASSSEMFGESIMGLPITEKTPMNPLSIYATSKVASHFLAVNYRQIYGVFVGIGILFNHESVLRSNNFFVKKIIIEALKIKTKQQKILKVGNISVKRDFGYSPKYVEAMHLIMQHKIPDSFIVCTGRSYLLSDILNFVYDYLDIDRNLIVVDENLYRHTEIHDIYGDNSKIKTELNWEYKYDFYQVLEIMINEMMHSHVKS
ncbi:MAG: GDP-mannose 4,6-dehydratase [Lutibacter sp.]|nr:GDP-mannose 4,6-dehydratase [Lutibacter sp.]